MSAASDVIARQVAWTRLIAIVEEQAQTLIRIAFSPTVREAGDLSAGVFDIRGRMLAQAVTGTPGHVNAMAAAVGHVLDRHPLQTMAPGDVFTTNDPWKGTGHLNDFTVVTPVFRFGAPFALVASTSHLVDVGGLGFGTDGADVHEEGIYIPIVRLAREGAFDPLLLEIIRANVRFPMEVEGDLRALAACNEVCGRRLLELAGELKLASLEELGEFILAASERGMRAAIGELPQGVFSHAMIIDGLDAPVELRATLTIADGQIDIDFAGTSAQVDRGINVPLIYTEAMASFGVRCVIGGAIPNNTGSLAPVKVRAPLGSILNAPHPAPVSARHVTGQMIPDVVLGALAQAAPRRVPAEGASALWILAMFGGRAGARGDSRAFGVNCFHNGGTGARPGKDGLSATAFPSGVRSGSIEVTEAAAPLVFWSKTYRPGSGGAGEFRGGLGQTIEVGHVAGEAFTVSCLFDRVEHAARGRFGGEAGATGQVRLGSGRPLAAKGRQGVPAGDTVVFETPGGGGLGATERRAPDRRRTDIEAGFVQPGADEADPAA
jgi:N-methylhydantoinase B